MTKRDILEVAIKIMGLYLVLSFLGSIAIVGGAIATADNTFIGSKTVYVLFTCLASFLYLVFAVAFLCRGRRIAEMLTRDSAIAPTGGRSALPPYAHLSFWVRILGLCAGRLYDRQRFLVEQNYWRRVRARSGNYVHTQE